MDASVLVLGQLKAAPSGTPQAQEHGLLLKCPCVLENGSNEEVATGVSDAQMETIVGFAPEREVVVQNGSITVRERGLEFTELGRGRAESRLSCRELFLHQAELEKLFDVLDPTGHELVLRQEVTRRR